MPNIHHSTGTFNIPKFLGIISRKRYLVLGIFVLISSIGIIYSYMVKKQYMANAIILIEKAKVINPLSRARLNRPLTQQEKSEELRTIRQLILSRTRLLQLIKKLDLDLTINTPLELEKLIEELRRSVQVNIRGNNLFRISYEGENPENVKSIVNTLCNIFIEENLSVTRESAYSGFAFIDNQLVVYKKKLEESENALRLFKEKNLGQMPGEKNLNLTKLEDYKNSLITTENELKEALLQKSLLEKQLSSEKPLILTFSSSNSDSLDPLETQLKRLNSRLNLLIMKYTDNYPEVINVKAQIEELNQQLAKQNKNGNKPGNTKSTTEALNPIYQKIKEDLGKINIRITILTSRIKEYKDKIELYTQKVESIPKQEQELVRLQRDYAVNVEIYQTLLSKLEEARISRELEVKERGDSFQIIDAAQLPLTPSKPNRPKLILFGILIGLFSAFGLMYPLYYFDNSIANPEEIKNYFDYPLLTEIPIIISDNDIKKKRRSDLLFFSTSGAFIAPILGILIRELITKYLFFK